MLDTTCRCPACERGLRPFTVEHFEPWAFDLELDNGEPWRVEDFFLLFAEDYFLGTPENWLLVPEGNSKTTSLAGFAGYLLEHRHRAGIPWAASSRDQAEIGYRQLEGFVNGSKRLSETFKCQEGYRRIKNLVTGGRLQIFAADDKTGDGIIPTDAFLDELHRHKNLRLYRTWRGKLGKRGGQMSTISTGGEAGEEFEEVRERIRQEVPIMELRPGFIRCRNDQISFHEYALEEGGDMDDMEAVKRCNPFSLITVESLTQKRATPTMTPQHWSRFVCNLSTRSEFAAIQENEWHAAAVDAGEWPIGAPCWLGLDVGWKWDTTSAVPLFIRSHDFRLFGPSKVLIPPRDGTSLDPYKVERALIELHERNPFHTVVMDTARAEQLAEWISVEFGVTVIDRQQSNEKAVQDYERFMQALREGWLKHTGDHLLTRHALNAIARVLPTGAARFDRPHTSRQGEGKQDQRVIDALVAAAMAHSLAHEELTMAGGIVY